MLEIINPDSAIKDWKLAPHKSSPFEPKTKGIKTPVIENVDGTYSIDLHRLGPVKQFQLQGF